MTSFYTPEQAGELLGVHPMAVQRAVARGRLAAPALPNGQIRVTDADLTSFVKTRAGELALPPGLDPRQHWFSPLSSYFIDRFTGAAKQAIAEYATSAEFARRARAGESRVDLKAPAAALRQRLLKPLIRTDASDALREHFKTEAAVYLAQKARDHALRTIRQKTALTSPLRRLYASAPEYAAVRDASMARLKEGAISERYSLQVNDGEKSETRTVEVRIPHAELIGNLDVPALAF
ncbi:MAG: hypothetical protein RBS80_22970 [Thermoguttaceae bacterium]|jgi:excisionase family DNA binding protein|nr:hypothetical protein [Thermoguttaceae bacterium]